MERRHHIGFGLLQPEFGILPEAYMMVVPTPIYLGLKALLLLLLLLI
jgi:hypothetical protein